MGDEVAFVEFEIDQAGIAGLLQEQPVLSRLLEHVVEHADLADRVHLLEKLIVAAPEVGIPYRLHEERGFTDVSGIVHLAVGDNAMRDSPVLPHAHSAQQSERLLCRLVEPGNEDSHDGHFRVSAEVERIIRVSRHDPGADVG